MKEKLLKFKDSRLFGIGLMLLCILIGVGSGASAMTADVVAGEGGGVVGVGEIQSSQFSRENSEDLLLNDIEKKVVKIRPMGNPLEQISRYVTRRAAKSQIQQYYSTDVLPVKAKLSAAYTEPATGEDHITIGTDADKNILCKRNYYFPRGIWV